MRRKMMVDDMASTIAIRRLDRIIAARLPGFIELLFDDVSDVVSVAFASSVIDWLPERLTELAAELEAVPTSFTTKLDDSDKTVVSDVVTVACLVMVEKPAMEVDV